MNASQLKKPALRIGALNELISYHLRRVQTDAQNMFEKQQSDDMALSFRQFCALALIASNEAASQSELARLMHIERPTVLPICERLEHLDLISRRQSPYDRRSQDLFLTETGERLYQEYLNTAIRTDQKLCKNLSAQEIVLLMTLLRKINPDVPPDSFT